MNGMPTWEGFMVPCLQALSDGSTHSRQEMSRLVADVVGLSDEQRGVVLNSGEPMHANRIGWALSQLARVGALTRPSRGQYCITDAGRQVLAQFANGITEKQLDALGEDPTWAITPYASSKTPEPPTKVGPTSLDPTEQIQQGISRLHKAVSEELLDRLLDKEPAFFEQAVVDLIVAMGYGGADTRAVRTQLTNDGGIDGIIDQDVLGLSSVYVQAKRYGLDQVVGRPEVQGFVGAIHGRRSSQGVFITTARFSQGARDYAASIQDRVVLVDGTRLAALMLRYRVGVQVRRTVDVVEIDEDFFE